jgi:hypothetical protein
MMTNYALRRWLSWEILGKKIPRKPPQKESLLSSKPPRDPRYRAWIRSLPCATCGTSIGVEACHTGPHALGQKASDYSCIPLCGDCHRMAPDAYHRVGRAAFEQRFHLQVHQLVERLNRIWETLRHQCDLSMPE